MTNWPFMFSYTMLCTGHTKEPGNVWWAHQYSSASLNLLPFLQYMYFCVRVISFITNRKYAFF